MFNYFNEATKEVELNQKMPRFCSEYLKNRDKKCLAFYETQSSNSPDERMFTCPYGFSCYKHNGLIYTNLLITGFYDVGKVNRHLKDYGEKISEYSILSSDMLAAMMKELTNVRRELDIYTFTIHDLKNAVTHFVDMAVIIKGKTELSELISANEELFSAVEGYSLISYLLKYHDQRLGLIPNAIKTECKPHPMITKLAKLLRFRAIKKDAEIIVIGRNDNVFQKYNDIYLGYFILIENAIKYSLFGRNITISISDLSEKTTSVTITNFTDSVEEKDIEHLTTAGYRSQLSKSPGNGLGLNLAQRIFDKSDVKLHFEISNEKGVNKFKAITIL